MKRLLQSFWLVPALGGVLFLAGTAAAFFTARLALPQPVKATTLAAGDDPSWRFRNPEFDQWVAELRREKENLALREQQAKELETRVAIEQQELQITLQAVRQLQTNFDNRVIQFTAQEAENLKRQGKLLTGMSPEAAAALLNEMSDDDVVRILFHLKNDQVSQLLESLSKLDKAAVKRAASLTEKLRLVLPPPNAPMANANS